MAIEGFLIVLITFLSYRRRVRSGAEKYASEAFYRAYAKDRGLEIEEPLHFAATHAEAKLPFKPDRVFTGSLPGGLNGSLLLLGDAERLTAGLKEAKA